MKSLAPNLAFDATRQSRRCLSPRAGAGAPVNIDR